MLLTLLVRCHILRFEVNDETFQNRTLLVLHNTYKNTPVIFKKNKIYFFTHLIQ